jgi:D-xylose transport system permease protein
MAEDTPTNLSPGIGTIEALNPPPEAASGRAVSQSTAVVSLGSYVRTYVARVRGGDSGMLPVVTGLVLISIVFQIANSHFLSPENLVNLLQQGSIYMVMAMGVVFVLLLGEIDLSVGYVGLVGGAVAAEMLAAAHPLPMGIIVVLALATTAAIGFTQGLLITRLGLPSFVVTLAGLLGWEGVLLLILGNGGTVPINDNVFDDFATAYIKNLTVTWVIVGAIVAVFALVLWRRDTMRRSSGLVAPPVSLTVVKVLAIAGAGAVLGLLVNANRGALAIAPIRGMPWFILEVLAILVLWSLLLSRTRPGRYLYAIGGNREAARRAGINTQWIRTLGFTLCSLNGGIAGLLIAGQFRGIATSIDGGQLVLYSIAAAVIGGTSLFGGRGKAIHGVVGGLVIAGIVNGMALIGLSAQLQLVMTGVVLMVAVTVDAVTHRRATSAT